MWSELFFFVFFFFEIILVTGGWVGAELAHVILHELLLFEVCEAPSTEHILSSDSHHYNKELHLHLFGSPS